MLCCSCVVSDDGMRCVVLMLMRWQCRLGLGVIFVVVMSLVR